MAVIKPSDSDIELAMARAQEMLTSSHEDRAVAHALEFYRHRVALLEHVFRAADLYLRFGLTPQHHQDLLMAVDAVKHDRLVEGEEEPDAAI